MRPRPPGQCGRARRTNATMPAGQRDRIRKLVWPCQQASTTTSMSQCPCLRASTTALTSQWVIPACQCEHTRRPMWPSTLTGSDKSNEMAKRPLSCMKIAFHPTNPPKWHEEKMKRRFISATAGASPSASSSPSQETPVRNCSVHELLNASHALRALLCRKARSRNGLVVPFRQIWHLEPLSRAATSRFCQERQFGRKRRRTERRTRRRQRATANDWRHESGIAHVSQRRRARGPNDTRRPSPAHAQSGAPPACPLRTRRPNSACVW